MALVVGRLSGRAPIGVPHRGFHDQGLPLLHLHHFLLPLERPMALRLHMPNGTSCKWTTRVRRGRRGGRRRRRRGLCWSPHAPRPQCRRCWWWRVRWEGLRPPELANVPGREPRGSIEKTRRWQSHASAGAVPCGRRPWMAWMANAGLRPGMSRRRRRGVHRSHGAARPRRMRCLRCWCASLRTPCLADKPGRRPRGRVEGPRWWHSRAAAGVAPRGSQPWTAWAVSAGPWCRRWAGLRTPNLANGSGRRPISRVESRF
mmetsp:Transcript_6555/g.18271  ORF Transcript_6555/g.18271 Transcript_6555/m.18271 type:complete len:259 (+) Transcript_6555:633-1409(+)